jgi:hypothetical protein
MRPVRQAAASVPVDQAVLLGQVQGRGAPGRPSPEARRRDVDFLIADAQQVLGALKIIGANDPAFMRGLMERVMALQAERAKLTALA